MDNEALVAQARLYRIERMAWELFKARVVGEQDDMSHLDVERCFSEAEMFLAEAERRAK